MLYIGTAYQVIQCQFLCDLKGLGSCYRDEEVLAWRMNVVSLQFVRRFMSKIFDMIFVRFEE